MAKESITVQCYPSDEEINKTIKQYEPFGWEVTESQRFEQGKDGFRWDGSGTFYTYHVLTFTREKNEAWYEEVSKLEKQYHETLEKRDAFHNTEPNYSISPTLQWFLSYFYIIMGVVIGLLLTPIAFVISGEIGFYWIFIPIVILAIFPTIAFLHKAKIKKYKKLHAEWHDLNDRKLEAMQQEADEIAEKSAAIIRIKN